MTKKKLEILLINVSKGIKIISFLIPIIVFCFSIYWMSVLPKILMKGIGSSILIANIFLSLLSLISAAFMVIVIVKKVTSRHIFFQIYCAMTCICILLCFILINLSTPFKCDRYYSAFIDYLNRHSNYPDVGSFLNKHSTQHSRDEFIYNSIASQNSLITSLFGIWLAFFLITCFVLNLHEKILLQNTK